MKIRAVQRGVAVLAVVVLLPACASLPREAREAALNFFEPERQPRIHSARRVDPLPEDERVGADEVWCVNVAFRCWSRGHEEWYTCISSYLVRHIDGAWQAVEMVTREDLKRWAARGCPRELDIAVHSPRRQDMLAYADGAHFVEQGQTAER
jgi:hypothetical protein